MNSPHVIRLRKPWSCQILTTENGDAGHDTVPGVEVPGDWSDVVGARFRGKLRYVRFFNRPTGIGGGTTVRLTFQLVDGSAEITLNGQAVGNIIAPSFSGEFDIVHLLESRNQLVVDVEIVDTPEPTGRPPSRTADHPGGLLGEVQLEIS